MSMEVAISALIRRIESLEAHLVAQDRRINNMFREGSIAEVDYEKGLASMDAGGLPTDMSPWLERAGAVRDWTPVTKGERAIFISPTGDPGQGLILPGGYSSQFAQPHNKGAEPSRHVGNVTVRQTGEAFTVEVGGVTFKVSAEGVTFTGGKNTHDGLDVGASHTHGGVVPGDGDTDIPNP